MQAGRSKKVRDRDRSVTGEQVAHLRRGFLCCWRRSTGNRNGQGDHGCRSTGRRDTGEDLGGQHVSKGHCNRKPKLTLSQSSDGSKSVQVGTRIAVLAEPGDDLSSLEMPSEDSAKESQPQTRRQDRPSPQEELSSGIDTTETSPSQAEALPLASPTPTLQLVAPQILLKLRVLAKVSNLSRIPSPRTAACRSKNTHCYPPYRLCSISTGCLQQIWIRFRPPDLADACRREMCSLILGKSTNHTLARLQLASQNSAILISAVSR